LVGIELCASATVGVITWKLFGNLAFDGFFLPCFFLQLERQLNAIYNKEEEERIRKEEAAKEDG
jgi:hypothetical protein